MAANHSSTRGARLNNPVPVIVPILGGAGMAVLTFGAVILFWTMVFSDDAPPVPPAVVKAPEPPPLPVPAPKVEAWWDKLPDTRLAGTVILLKQVLPQDQPLFDSLGDAAEAARLASYQKLTAKLPELVRNPQARSLAGRFVTDCYALEPADANVTPLRNWLVSQIPQENAEFPAGYKSEDLDRSLWALDVGMDALAHKAPIRPERLKPLAADLGKSLGFTIDSSIPPGELRLKAEKLLALRCYRNLAPTAVKSLDGALAIREALVAKVGQHLSPKFREKADLDIAFAGLASANASWPAYSALLRDCLDRKNPATDLEMVELYAQADPETAVKMEPLVSGKWKVLNDRKLTREAKVKAIQKALGIPDPTERLTQFEKLARETLYSADAPPNKSRALLQEAARLAHASTLACALLQKDAGNARFDEWIAKVPKIDQGEPDAPVAKGGKTKQPAGNPTPPAGNPGVAIGAAPTVMKGALDPSCQRDPYRPNSFCRVHVVALKRGRSYEINMLSSFDNYLRLENSKKLLLMEDDDSGVGLNAQIQFTAPVDDSYRIIATSYAGGMGPYVLTVQEVPGFGPGFGGPGFPMRAFPFRAKFGFPPPGMVPGMIPPQQPPVEVEKPKPATGTGAAPQVDQADLANLHEKIPQKTRVTAFHNIVANLPDDLAHNDLAARHAQALARYLLTMKAKTEVDEIVAKIAPAGKSRNLLLALADKVDQPDAEQRAGEAVVGALTGQPLQSGKEDNWSLRCRKLLLLEALNIADKQKNAATQTADIIRNQYREQGILLGMGAPAFKQMTRPGHVIESVIKHLADKVAKQNPAAEQKEYLDQVPRHLLVAQFVAQNDLDQTVMLQRVWLKILSIHLAQQNPQRAKEIRELQQESSEGDRASANVLVQLRGGEEQILRLWVLALDQK